MDNDIIVKIFGVDLKNLDTYVLKLYDKPDTMLYLKECYDRSQEYISKYINLVMDYIYGYLLYSEKSVFDFIKDNNSKLLTDLLNKVHLKKNTSMTLDLIKKIMKNENINKSIMMTNAYIENIKYFKLNTNGITEEKYGLLSFVTKIKKKDSFSIFMDFYKKKVFGYVLDYIYEMVNMNFEYYDDDRYEKCSSIKYLMNIAIILLKMSSEIGIDKNINKINKLKIFNSDTIGKKIFIISCLLFKLIHLIYSKLGTNLKMHYFFNKFIKMYLDTNPSNDNQINENVLCLIEEYNFIIDSQIKDKCINFVLSNLNYDSNDQIKNLSFDIIKNCKALSSQKNILNDMINFIGANNNIDPHHIEYILDNIRNIKKHKMHFNTQTINKLIDLFGDSITKLIERMINTKKIISEELLFNFFGNKINLVIDIEPIIYDYYKCLVALLDMFYVSDDTSSNNILIKKSNNINGNNNCLNILNDESIVNLPIAISQSILFYSNIKTSYSLYIIHLSLIVIEKFKNNKTFSFLFNSAGDMLLDKIKKMNISDKRKQTLNEMLQNDETIDDSLLDPLLLIPIKTPIMIPKIDEIFDKASILSHVHKNNNNPYTREHLTMADVYEYNKTLFVKEKIDEFNIKMNEYKKKFV